MEMQRTGCSNILPSGVNDTLPHWLLLLSLHLPLFISLYLNDKRLQRLHGAYPRSLSALISWKKYCLRCDEDWFLTAVCSSIVTRCSSLLNNTCGPDGRQGMRSSMRFYQSTWRPWWVLLQDCIMLRLLLSSSVVSRAFSALCVYSKFGHLSHPLSYRCAQFRFFRCIIHCWSSRWRKIVYSINHSVTHTAYWYLENRSACFSENRLALLGIDYNFWTAKYSGGSALCPAVIMSPM